MSEEVAAAIEAHRSAGRSFTAAGVTDFVREQGDGEPIVRARRWRR